MQSKFLRFQDRHPRLTGKGEVKPPVQGNVGRVPVLPGAHELSVINGRLCNRGGRRLLAHHAYPVVGPRFLFYDSAFRLVWVVCVLQGGAVLCYSK